MPTAVGVDAGGTRCAAIAMHDDELLRSVEGAGANPNLYGVEFAADAIADAVRRAAPVAPDAIVVGAAGAGRAHVAQALVAALIERFPTARVAVSDDAHIALRAAIPLGDAIALIAGTGSMAYAEIGSRRYRSGGFGYLLGDEGSGYAIGAAALRLLLRAYEGSAASDPMLDALAEKIGASSVPDVLAYVYSDAQAVSRIAALAPLAIECAASGERSATKLVQAAALDLFDLVKSVRRQSGCDGELPLALCGGLLTQNSMLTYLLETRIANEFPQLAVVKNPAQPEFGALAEARALLDGNA